MTIGQDKDQGLRAQAPDRINTRARVGAISLIGLVALAFACAPSVLTPVEPGAAPARLAAAVPAPAAAPVAVVPAPVGVVAAILPTTNPTSTAIYKSLIALKAGNAIVISPHPNAMRCTCETAAVLYQAQVPQCPQMVRRC